LRPRQRPNGHFAQPAPLLPETASTHAMKAGFACPIQLLLQRRATRTTQKEKNETDFIKEYGNKNFASFDAHQ
jgi:hypothetical protein